MKRMAVWGHASLVTAGLLLEVWYMPILGYARECPAYAIGVHEVSTPNGKTYVAVAKVEALSEDVNSLELAKAEANIAARAMLLKVPDLRAVDPQVLRGARTTETCVVGAFTYVTVAVSPQSQRAATQLEKVLEESFRKNPTPQ